MIQRTCSIEDCTSPARSKGMCPKHYERQRVTEQSRPCDGCGAEIERTATYGKIPKYCSTECKPSCAVEGCDVPAVCRTWCMFHYSRWKLTGDPGQMYDRVYYEPAQMCAFPECGQPRRKREWCSTHYGQLRRTGRTWKISHWSNNAECPVCGGPTGTRPGYRNCCSPKCRALFNRHKGEVADAYECVHCGDSIPAVIEGRRRISTRVKFCKRCRQDIHKHGVSAAWLAERDGMDCGICSEPVDMTAIHPDRMRPSVDHIVARANGGTNDPENLQLAHLWCNQVKSDRIGFTLAGLPVT